MHVAEKFVSRRKESEKSISDANSFVCSNAKQKKRLSRGLGLGIGFNSFGNVNGSRRAGKYKQMALGCQGECHTVSR